ncbi:uncharacterized protein LOC118180998 [Stegodyphus dumicola]|uniref:uncharacterized protein LOC118180998 n=1 Tax=Stegodyphus dumicola TaxID=202533 RepID=UPI0015AD3412|nr:uncharacterized protein LOC118180998 [Stegodyphus dumicola]
MRKVFFYLIFVIEVCKEVVFAQGAVTANPPVAPALALGGFVQALLDMQIRPHGGYYEEKYKEIFHDDGAPEVVVLGKRRTDSQPELQFKEILSQDGKLLQDATLGKNPNPCFESDRIHRNRLLALVCAMQLRNVWHRNT